MSSNLSLNFGRLRYPFIGLSFSSEAEFVSSFFLVSLREGIPVLGVGVDVGISSNERFLFVDANDSNDFRPLISDVTLFVSLDNGRFDMVVVIDSIGHLEVVVVVEDDVSRGEHIIFVAHCDS